MAEDRRGPGGPRDHGEAGVASETINLPTLAGIFGINIKHAYELAQADELPVPVIRVGRQLRFSRRVVEALLDKTHPPDREAS